MAELAMLIDVTKCTACRGCQVACKQWNELEADLTTNWGSYQNPPDLTPNTWNLVKFKEVARDGKVKWLFRPHRCMHCTDAACVTVCPSGALFHHELGFVAYDKDKCTGCGYCADFCPFHVPRSERSLLTGIARMDKCTFCQDRASNGLEPACAKTCPPGAIKFGTRAELIAEGKARVAKLRETNPQANFYGEHECGGLHMMYVLDEPPEVYDLPPTPSPIEATAWQGILQPIGLALGGLTVLGLGLNYLVARANIKAKKES